jgi:hypothetical protein
LSIGLAAAIPYLIGGAIAHPISRNREADADDDEICIPREGVHNYVGETDGASDGAGIHDDGDRMDTGDGRGSDWVAGRKPERDIRQSGSLTEHNNLQR